MAHTVLVADDHPAFRSAARRLLEAEGYAVVAEAATGGETIEMAGRVRPDMVLLDIGLPDLDGIAVAQRLTGEATAPAVVLTSSRDRSDYGPLLERCGARGFIPKASLSGETLAALIP
jgi:DNA-binding NarL/FixJ family response regulator